MALLLIPAKLLEAQDPESLYQRGISLTEADRPQEAEDVLRSVLERDPAHSRARVLLGFLYLRRAALHQAEECFRRALEERPEDAGARLGLGISLGRQGLLRPASDELEKTLEDRRHGDAARVQWVFGLFLQGRDEEALREARDLVARFPSMAEYRRLLGLFYLALEKDQAKAFREYQAAAEIDPGDINTYLSLAGLARSLGDWEGALQWAQKALASDHSNPIVYRELGVIYERLGRTADAAEARTEEKRTYDAEVSYARSAAARAEGNISEAEELLRKSVEANPLLSKAWRDLGEMLRQDHRFEEARQAFLMALEADPGSSLAHESLAALLKEEGKDAEAEHAYRRALSRGLSTPDLHAGLAYTFLSQGKIKEAKTEMILAVRELPGDPDLLASLGHLEQIGGKRQEAREHFALALKHDPTHLRGLVGMGNLAMTDGDWNIAAEYFDRAVKTNPSEVEAWRGLIRAHMQSGSPARAEAACRACLVAVPDDIECREQLAWLRMNASDFKESALHYRRVLQEGKWSKSILDGLAFSLVAERKYGEAISLFETSLQKYGEDANVRANLGYLSRCTGDLASALRHYRRASVLEPDDPDRSYDLALALYMSGEYKAAVEPFLHALDLRPRWGEAHYNLSLTYWNLYRYPLALQHAQLAEEAGVREAASAVVALRAQLRPSASRSLSTARD